jgi:hypothetical protein
MRLSALLMSSALLAYTAIGCSDADTTDETATDTLGIDTSTTITAPPLDTATALDSMNAPVAPDTAAGSRDTVDLAKPSSSRDTTPSRGRTTISVGDTADTGVGGVGSGVRRGGSNNTSAGGRR